MSRPNRQEKLDELQRTLGIKTHDTGCSSEFSPEFTRWQTNEKSDVYTCSLCRQDESRMSSQTTNIESTNKVSPIVPLQGRMDPLCDKAADRLDNCFGSCYSISVQCMSCIVAVVLSLCMIYNTTDTIDTTDETDATDTTNRTFVIYDIDELDSTKVTHTTTEPHVSETHKRFTERVCWGSNPWNQWLRKQRAGPEESIHAVVSSWSNQTHFSLWCTGNRFELDRAIPRQPYTHKIRDNATEQ
jgi:hypothetical protein